jgi:hypothetical protein
LAGGWGLRDREAGQPVTADTLFAIGSVTKAFTATTVGALVDDGQLEWDRPLPDYVPSVRLADPAVSDRLTIVDLLSHRSGLPRHDLTWVGQPRRSRAEIVHALRYLPLSRDLRQEFQYCNLGYVAAGHVVEGIDGFQTQCMLLPDDGIGVMVLTNTSASLMHLVVAGRVLDELLGAEPLDLFGFFKPRFDALMSGAREARDARRVVPSAPAARPLSAYAGQYEHPGYGTFAITLDGDALRPSLGTMDLSLVHRHYETFDLEWHELADEQIVFPLTFLADADGDVNALTVQFEPLVEALRFDRRPDTLSPETLRRLCGSYVMGPIEITVALRGERTLTVTAPGSPPLDLEPITGLRFGVKDQPAITAEFELDDHGAVARLIAQPLGIFLPQEASAS